MQVAVAPVESKRDLNTFIRFPLELYRHDPLYVPPLLHERKKFFNPANPIFEFTEVTYFLARDSSGRAVGRVTAHINRRHNAHAGEKTGFFGFFDCIDDPSVARALLTAAEKKLRDRGMQLIRGPFNFSTNEECGLLVQGYDRPPALMMPYNKPYYADFFPRLDYRRAKDLLAYAHEHRGRIPDFLTRFSRRLRERKRITVRSVDMQRFEQDLATIFKIYNAAWSRNWGFVPVTEGEFRYTARDLKPIADPALVLIAEKEGQPVAFSVSLPDYNIVLKKMNGRLMPFGLLHWLLGRRRITRLRTLLLGVVEQYRHSGIEALLIHDTFCNGMSRGYLSGEMSWILEDNQPMRRILERIGARIEKTYRLYEKQL